MEKWKIPLYKVYTDDEDINLITRIIRRGTSWAIGSEIEEFEKAIQEYVGVEYCVALNSGTSALHATLLAYGINNDDQVIVPSFSFISTANSVLFVNAKPVFADIEEETFGLDPNSIKTNLGTNTKAVMPMDYGGMSCKIFDIKEITEKNNLVLIEDAAESLGSTIKGKKVGSVSDSAIFSFCGNKVLTTGEGGAVVTNSKEIYDRIKLLRSHGRLDSSDYFNDQSEAQYVSLGYNWRMSTLTAALGISQIQKLDKIIKKRQENAAYISSRLSKILKIRIPLPPKDHEHIYQMYTLRVSSTELRDELHNFLKEKRIFSKIYFNPIHKTSFYSKLGYQNTVLPTTDKVSSQILTIPLYPNMEQEEKEYLVSTIQEFFERPG